MWAEARVPFRHRQDLVGIPEYPTIVDGRDGFCLEDFGAGSTQAATVPLGKPQEYAHEMSKCKRHWCLPAVPLRKNWLQIAPLRNEAD